MKATIEVKDRKEADAIRRGLEDPEARAVVIVTGLLAPLSERARKRTLAFVSDVLDEQQQSLL